MSKLISYSQISINKELFDSQYQTALQSSDLQTVQNAVQTMSDLADKITTALNTAPAHVKRFFDWGAKEVTVDVETIKKEVESKIHRIITHAEKISPPPLQGRIAPTPSPSIDSDWTLVPSSSAHSYQPNPNYFPPSPAKSYQAANDYAVGFGNFSANCWANSLLSMIVFIPTLRQAYMTVANYHAQKNFTDPSRVHGIALQNALTAYDFALGQKQSVSADVSQSVRAAFNHLFGHKNSTTQQEIFSLNSWKHEDAYEAMLMIMGEYERILRKQNSDNPAFSTLYSPMEFKRKYTPIGEQRDKLSQGSYSTLNQDNSSSVFNNEYQVLIELQNRGHLPFQTLLFDYFKNTNVEGHDKAQYLLPNDKLQDFKLTEECRQFVRVPNEFILTLKRFGAQSNGSGYKILSPVAISRLIALPPEATRENKSIAYELDSFIVHRGRFGGGHYVCYKKIEQRWIEVDDSSVRFVETNEIDQILHGQKGTENTSYMHHYTRVPDAQQSQAIHTVQTEGTSSSVPMSTIPLNDAKEIIPAIKACVKCDVGYGNTLGIRFNTPGGHMAWQSTHRFTWTENGWMGEVPQNLEFKFVSIASNNEIRWEKRDQNRTALPGQTQITFETGQVQF